VHLVDQPLEHPLRHAEGGAEVYRLVDQREVVGRQCLQGEAALAAGERQLVLRRGQAHRLVGREHAEDVDQLARTHGGGEGAFVTAQGGPGAHLDLQITGRELDLFPVFAHQHIGQDGQGVAPLHDAGHCLQGLEQMLLRRFQNNHVFLLNW